jgi:uncharacterized membrane protein
MTTPETRERRPDELDVGLMQWSRWQELKESAQMIISHHPPSYFGHCLRVSFMGKSVYFCGRCSGIYGGLAAGLLILLVGHITLEPSWLWFLGSVAIGFATVVDWTTQRLTPRKTTVRIRAVTGFLSGLSLAVVFVLANLVYLLVTLIIMGGSIGLVGAIEAKRNRTTLPEQPPEAISD